MVDPVVARGAFALVGLLTAFWFDVSDPHILGLAAGGVALATGLLDVIVAGRSGARGKRALLVRTAGWTALGLALLLSPARSAEALGRVGAGAVLVMALVTVLPGIRRRTGDSTRYARSFAGAGVVIALLMWGWPYSAGRSVLAVVAAAWIGGAALQMYASAQAGERIALRTTTPFGPIGGPGDSDPTATGTLETDETGTADEPVLEPLIQPTATRTFLTWLRSRELSREDRAELEGKLFFRGAKRRERTYRFFTLMFLSVVIATLGVMTDSTAVVVGAMLIAPLMTPIMAVAEALVSGRPASASRAAGLVFGGALLAVATSAILSRAVPAFTVIEGNSQIASRVSPTLLDMLIALASGITGAIVLTRKDVSDALPGVAIAVALVPPLAVIGVTFQAGAWSDVWGALLLFLTNLVSVVLAGGVTFMFTGAVPVDRLVRHRDQLRVYGGTVLAGLLILAVPLAATGQQITTSVTNHDSAQRAVERWLEPYDADLADFEVRGSRVSALVTGEGDPPGTDDVMTDLTDILGSDARLELRWVPETRLVVEAD